MHYMPISWGHADYTTKNKVLSTNTQKGRIRVLHIVFWAVEMRIMRSCHGISSKNTHSQCEVNALEMNQVLLVSVICPCYVPLGIAIHCHCSRAFVATECQCTNWICRSRSNNGLRVVSAVNRCMNAHLGITWKGLPCARMNGICGR